MLATKNLDEYEEQMRRMTRKGVISLLDVQNGIVYVKMGGGCQGCASSTATLKQGVEQSIRARVEGVVEILDTTDHAAGSNPYYAPSM